MDQDLKKQDLTHVRSTNLITLDTEEEKKKHRVGSDLREGCGART